MKTMIRKSIHIENLRKTFGTGETAVTAVDGVSFTAEPGSVVGLLGPNGAGKTTTIKMSLGLVIPDGGTVEVAGVNIHENPQQAYSHVGAIMEGARNIYWRLTVRENLEFFAGLGGDSPSEVRDRHDELLELVDLAERADTTVNELSRGMKQKVALASTLARDVDVVFMDEPTLGLDVESSHDLRTELRRLADREDITIILTSHDMDVIEAVCDRVLILQNGSIICDDYVDTLLDVFDVKHYRVTVGSLPLDATRDELEHRFDATIQTDDDLVHIEVTVTDVDTLYELLTDIKTREIPLVDIQSREPNLEDVFLRLTDERDDVPSTTSRCDAEHDIANGRQQVEKEDQV